MHSKGDDGIRGRAAVGAICGRDGGENSAIMFESFAFNVLTARGEGGVSGGSGSVASVLPRADALRSPNSLSSQQHHSQPTGPTTAPSDISCAEYQRGAELLFCICPNSIYLFPNERIKTAFLTEVTVHVNCSCPFPCLELRVMATLPQGLQRRFRGVAGDTTANNTPRLDPAVLDSLTEGSGSLVRGPNAFHSKAFSSSTPYAFINDREVAAQMSRRQKEQQKTFIRIIGFSSEGLLREAISVLMELGAKPPPVSEHFQRILSPLSLVNSPYRAAGRSGARRGATSPHYDVEGVLTSSQAASSIADRLHKESFLFERNGNEERLKSSPFYAEGLAKSGGGGTRSPRKSVVATTGFSVLNSGANAHVSTLDRDEAVSAAVGHALSLPAAPMLRLVFHAQSWEDATFLGSQHRRTTAGGGGLMTEKPPTSFEDPNEQQQGKRSATGSGAGPVMSSIKRLQQFRERRREKEKLERMAELVAAEAGGMDDYLINSADSPLPPNAGLLASPQHTMRGVQPHPLGRGLNNEGGTTRTSIYSTQGRPSTHNQQQQNYSHQNYGGDERVEADEGQHQSQLFRDVDDQATTMLAAIESMLKETSVATPTSTPNRAVGRSRGSSTFRI